MKKIYAIVFYYDQSGKKECRKVNILFENEQNAIMIADKICKEKKLFFKLEEYLL